MIVLESHFLSPHPIPASGVSRQMKASFLEECWRPPTRRQPQLQGLLKVLSPADSSLLQSAQELRMSGSWCEAGSKSLHSRDIGTWTSLGAMASQPVRRCCSSSGGEGLSSWRCSPPCHSHSSSGEERKRPRAGHHQMTQTQSHSTAQVKQGAYKLGSGVMSKEAPSSIQRPLPYRNRKGLEMGSN